MCDGRPVSAWVREMRNGRATYLRDPSSFDRPDFRDGYELAIRDIFQYFRVVDTFTTRNLGYTRAEIEKAILDRIATDRGIDLR